MALEDRPEEVEPEIAAQKHDKIGFSTSQTCRHCAAEWRAESLGAMSWVLVAVVHRIYTWPLTLLVLSLLTQRPSFMPSLGLR